MEMGTTLAAVLSALFSVDRPHATQSCCLNSAPSGGVLNALLIPDHSSTAWVAFIITTDIGKCCAIVPSCS
ncbi:hypothetical protein BD410DRAFT_651656 [Rickenella mellea]|uniref:Hydrophobin n=1 Tax=Rickenella mellea TaxID=50990 RepID=A0A4Y7PKQ4_9AGAM|nr:hypothetical protein BD410DRAFT_651656 [Rickenella mellea]